MTFGPTTFPTPLPKNFSSDLDDSHDPAVQGLGERAPMYTPSPRGDATDSNGQCFWHKTGNSNRQDRMRRERMCLID